jgi:hypothetical protein
MHLIVNLIGLIIINISYQTKKNNLKLPIQKKKTKNETHKLTLFNEKVKIPLKNKTN